MVPRRPIQDFVLEAVSGPGTVKDCITDGNALEGVKICAEKTGIDSMAVTRNTVANNLYTGVAIYDFTVPVDFETGSLLEWDTVSP